MAATAECQLTRQAGEPAVRLRSGRLALTVTPRLGLLGTSLCFDGEEYLSLHGGLRAWRAGHTTGMPLLYPWANRLAGPTFRAAGVGVSLEGAPTVHTDAGGLPIHGTMLAATGWRLDRLSAGRRAARLEASFDSADHPEQFETFPYPHILAVTMRLADERLTVTTTVTPTTTQAVPVSFGWHPYFTLPGVRRSSLTVLLPKRRHLELDGQGLPTGAETKEKAEAEPLGRRTFDDAYRLGKDRVLGLGGRGRGLTVEFDDGYPYAQVYAPAGKRFVALEPMTAPTNALITGEAPLARRKQPFSASFTVRIGHE